MVKLYDLTEIKYSLFYCDKCGSKTAFPFKSGDNQVCPQCYGTGIKREIKPVYKIINHINEEYL